MPGVAAWIETGSIWQIDVFLPYVAPGHYPNNGDVLLLAAVLPWQSDFLAHLVLWPVYALAGVGVYALARELGAARQASISAAVLILALPAVLLPALIDAYPDALMLFGFAAGLTFLVRNARSGATRDLVLAGLALGVSFGTKWYGVSAVAVVLVVWFVASLGGRPRARPRGARGADPRRPGRCSPAGSGSCATGSRRATRSSRSRSPRSGSTIFDAPRDIVRERAGFDDRRLRRRPGRLGRIHPAPVPRRARASQGPSYSPVSPSPPSGCAPRPAPPTGASSQRASPRRS